MPTLLIRTNELITVTDLFGTIAVTIRKWANVLFKEEAVEETDEPHDTDDSPDSGSDPPDLSINVDDKVDTKDIWGS